MTDEERQAVERFEDACKAGPHKGKTAPQLYADHPTEGRVQCMGLVGKSSYTVESKLQRFPWPKSDLTNFSERK